MKKFLIWSKIELHLFRDIFSLKNLLIKMSLFPSLIKFASAEEVIVAFVSISTSWHFHKVDK